MPLRDAYSLLQANWSQETPITEQSFAPAGVRAVLESVAVTLSGTLLTYTESISEPTDHGYLRGYRLELAMGDGALERRLVFVEPAIRFASSPDILTVAVDGGRSAVAVWLYPSDPALPALRTLTDVASTAIVLDSLGIASVPIAVDVVSYRPGRRAVVRVDSEAQRLFVKVVEPGKAESISERHELFRSSGLPVPRVLGWSNDGVVAMTALPGAEAQYAISRMADHGAFLDQLEFLCALLEGVSSINTARPSLFNRLDWYVQRLSERLPGDIERIAAVGAAIAAKGAEGHDFEFTPVTIHGDLHLGQLFVDSEAPSEIAGMLDIDTAGVGDPADDAAAFYAHLIALAESIEERDAASAQACIRLADAWAARWPRNRNAGFDARARAIAATHLFGHALQPNANDPTAVSRRLLERANALVAG